MYVYLLPLPITDLDVHLDAMSESCALIEGVEGEFLDERDTVDLYVVALGSKLHVLHLLATDDGPHVWLRCAHDPVGNAFPGVIAVEVVLLLAVHLCDNAEG